MQLVDVNGIELRYVDEGDGPPLLLVHGFPLDHSMWKHQIQGLTGALRVIAPDLRGFGKSGVTDGTVSMEQFADDLAALLDALNLEQPVALCGLSMGGYIAFAFARKYPQRLSRLILCDTRAVGDDPAAKKKRRESADRVLAAGVGGLVEDMLPRLFHPLTLERHPRDVEQIKQVMMDANPHGVAAALQGMAERPDSTALLKKIRVPTLVIVGEKDLISPAKEMREIADGISGARFVKVAEAGHMAPLECPQVVNAELRAFVVA